MSAVEARTMIAEFGGIDTATLRRGATSCPVTAVTITPSSGGMPANANSLTMTDERRAYIAAVDANGDPIAITPKRGDRLERNGKAFGLGVVRMIDPDGIPLAYIAELQG